MDLANYVSLQFGLIDRGTYEELHALLAANYAGFEAHPIPEDRLLAGLAKDKKNLGERVTLILLRGPGQVFRDQYVADARFRGICHEFLASLAAREAACPSS